MHELQRTIFVTILGAAFLLGCVSVPSLPPCPSTPSPTQKDKDRRLGKVPNIPGTEWAYNNWDYTP